MGRLTRLGAFFVQLDEHLIQRMNEAELASSELSMNEVGELPPRER